MQTIDSVLREAVVTRDDDRVVTLDPAFQGLPGMAHGGTVLAIFDALAELHGWRRISGAYRRRVPLGVSLRLRTSRGQDGVAFDLLDDASVLVDGCVEGVAAFNGATAPWRDAEYPLPVSGSCFACGVDNPLGLRARLRFDDMMVTGSWVPLERFRALDDSLAPMAVTALLDEAAFWLGALATGESGMTTRIAVALAPTIAFGAVTVSGARARVSARGEDPRYRDTRIDAWNADGHRIATAEITFVAIRGAARKLAAWVLERNPPEVLRRVFPTYVA